MKRLAIALALMLAVPGAAAAAPGKAPVLEPISAASAVLIEAGSGRVLYEHNAREKRPMASTTKMMTALIATELSRPEDVVTISPDCVKIEGASLYLEENAQLTMADLLYGTLLRSGNDGAAAIAKHVAGDIGHFVSLMNQRAWSLGMADTRFGNPHGLDVSGHYSTAYDMARLGAAFLKVPLLKQICTTEEYISRELTGGRLRIFKNNNKLLIRDPRACGIKIGWTEQAGRCLVAAARVGEMELVAVVLGAPDLYTDASKLLDYGFAGLKMQELVPKGKVMAILPVSQGSAGRVAAVTAQPVCYPVFAGETLYFTAEIQVPLELKAPIQSGQAIGSALVTVDPGWIQEVKLVAVSEVKEKKGLVIRFLELVRALWHDK